MENTNYITSDQYGFYIIGDINQMHGMTAERSLPNGVEYAEVINCQLITRSEYWD
jgi:hypothetical protein